MVAALKICPRFSPMDPSNTLTIQIQIQIQIQKQKQKYKIKQLHGHLEDLSTLFTMVHSRVLTTRPTRLIILIVFTRTVPVAENKLHKYEVTTRKTLKDTIKIPSEMEAALRYITLLTSFTLLTWFTLLTLFHHKGIISNVRHFGPQQPYSF